MTLLHTIQSRLIKYRIKLGLKLGVVIGIGILIYIMLLLPMPMPFVEGFNSKASSSTSVNINKTYILLGDSILKNDSYIGNNKSVSQLIAERNNNQLNVVCLAKDNSKLIDIYGQIEQINVDYNTSNTTVFLSAGGNDILFYYVEQNQDITNTAYLQQMLTSYTNVVNSIRVRLPKATICLIDVYYPNSLRYQRFHSVIKSWNELVDQFARQYNYNILHISKLLTESTDFAFHIEPSFSGGEKIANRIANY